MREKTWVDKWIFTLKAMIFLGVDSQSPEANMYLNLKRSKEPAFDDKDTPHSVYLWIMLWGILKTGVGIPSLGFYHSYSAQVFFASTGLLGLTFLSP